MPSSSPTATSPQFDGDVDTYLADLEAWLDQIEQRLAEINNGEA